MTKKGANRPGAETAALTLSERFWKKVQKTPTCWLWTGAKSCGGHGVVWTGGQPYQKPAHHVSLMLAGTEIPVGMFVDHVCRVRHCVYPGHLRVVTSGVNALENNLSPFAQNARKTHCKHGHPLSGDNILIVPSKGKNGTRCKSRACIACFLARRPNAKVINGVPIPGRS